MERELEFLRQQVEYLERVLETSLARIASLEARVAELERRPVAIMPAEEPEPVAHGRSIWEEEQVRTRTVLFWEGPRGRKRG